MADFPESHVVRVGASERDAKRIADHLLERFFEGEGAVGAFEAPDGSWFAEAHFPELPEKALIAAAVAEILQHAKIEYETLAAKDWIAASLEGLKIVRAGRFAIHGSHDRARIRPNETGIEIEAALAFGTGHHGTTLGCLRALERLARTEKPKRILDVGTGTAVLGIAAARAFHAPVIGTEIDRASVLVAKENVRANRALPYVGLLHTGSLSAPMIAQYTPYDLIFANILLLVLRQLARPIAALAAPGATVILSGLLPSQALAALARYRAQGMQLVRSETIENWTTLTLRKL
ncbi:MAG: 50S ribosomal protein L11 methyltransferase [Xanthobacteraceae bacterium]|nr:50S ribosomal protein L11 methyltransferase [Xanthobacteraceae bacterium]MCW5676495.1 50S ribosomal protein L11 methyltransferase [Xanthobacteraceae bacterium]